MLFVSLNFLSLTSIYSVSQERTTSACFQNTEGSGIWWYPLWAFGYISRCGNLHVLGLLKPSQSTFHSSNINGQHIVQKHITYINYIIYGDLLFCILGCNTVLQRHLLQAEKIHLCHPINHQHDQRLHSLV